MMAKLIILFWLLVAVVMMPISNLHPMCRNNLIYTFKYPQEVARMCSLARSDDVWVSDIILWIRGVCK